MAETGFFNNWKNGYIPPTSTMSSTNQDPYSGFKTGNQGQATSDPTALAIYNMSDAERREVALLLKNAGVKVPTNGKYSEALVNAYVAAAQSAALQSARLGKPFTVREYLAQETAGIVGDTGAAGGPSVREDIRIWDPTKAAGTIQDIVSSLVGREATPQEVTLLAGKLKAAQEKAATRTQYVTKNGKTTARVTGGLDEQQFLIETIQKDKKFKTELDALKAKKTTAAASAAQGVREDLNRTALANGIKLDENQFSNFESRLKAGEDIDSIKTTIRKTAALGMPDSVKQLIDSGIDLSTIYSPYRNILSDSLGINPNSITLNDPALRMAIGPDKELSLYDYQKAIRKDNRWKYSQEANDEVTNMVNQVKRDFGFMG